jgi:hypothetical protein
MASRYYAPCRELEICDSLFSQYWEAGEYGRIFSGLLPLAEQGYPLAECQVGYFYAQGLGVERDLDRALLWTRRAAEHGDRDGQFNLGCFYEEGTVLARDMEQAALWYQRAARQGHTEAAERLRALGVPQ